MVATLFKEWLKRSQNPWLSHFKMGVTELPGNDSAGVCCYNYIIFVIRGTHRVRQQR